MSAADVAALPAGPPGGRLGRRRPGAPGWRPRRTGWPTTWCTTPSCWRPPGPGPAARGCRAELGHAIATGTPAGRPAAPVGGTAAGPRGVVGEARAAVDGLRRRVRRPGGRPAAGDQHGCSATPSWSGRCSGCSCEDALGRPAGRAGGAAPPAPRGARPGRGARAADRQQGRRRRRPGHPGTACRRRARSTRARASSPPCCRCSAATPAGRRHRGRPARPRRGARRWSRQWWAVLTCDEQQRRSRGWPSAIGALDGLPGAVRSAANEHRLDARRRDAPDADRHCSDDERRWLDNCLLVRSELRPGAHRARPAQPRSVDRPAAGLRPPSLRLRGPRGDRRRRRRHRRPRGVPGAGAGVGGARVDGRADRQRAARHVRGPPGCAGHHDGDGGVDGLRRAGPARTSSFDGAAEDGRRPAGGRRARGPGLPRRGRRTSRSIGHSYGSTTAGTALRDHDTGVDDAVLVGSPGPNVEHASALHVPAGHVFVGASSRDPVSYVDRFGLDPTHERFGAVRFQAEDVTRNSWRRGHRRPLEVLRRPRPSRWPTSCDVVVGRLRGDRASPRTVTRCSCSPTASTATRRPTVNRPSRPMRATDRDLLALARRRGCRRGRRGRAGGPLRTVTRRHCPRPPCRCWPGRWPCPAAPRRPTRSARRAARRRGARSRSRPSRAGDLGPLPAPPRASGRGCRRHGGMALILRRAAGSTPAGRQPGDALVDAVRRPVLAPKGYRLATDRRRRQVLTLRGRAGDVKVQVTGYTRRAVGAVRHLRALRGGRRPRQRAVGRAATSSWTSGENVTQPTRRTTTAPVTCALCGATAERAPLAWSTSVERGRHGPLLRPVQPRERARDGGQARRRLVLSRLRTSCGWARRRAKPGSQVRELGAPRRLGLELAEHADGAQRDPVDQQVVRRQVELQPGAVRR